MALPTVVPTIVKKIIGIQGPAGQKFMPPARDAAGTTDTPTSDDHGGIIGFTSNSAVTVTVNDLGNNKSYSIQQKGTGQVTLSAGAGVTLVSGSFGTSFKTPRQYAVLTVNCLGGGKVSVIGDMA
jgi:hypothetical protein